MSANPDTIPIFQGQDFYVPTFQVKLRGRPLGHDVVRDILQVSYKDSLEEVDSFEISINNWDAETRDYKYIDQDLFDPGKEIELSMGYFGRDPLRVMIKGEITSLRPNFPPEGKPTLAITGLNILHRFRTEQVSMAYENLSDSQIARQIGGRLGVEVETDSAAEASEERYPYVFQDNQYDVIFLMERARRIGYDLIVREQDGQSTLYFGPSVNVRRVTYELAFGQSLIEFQPELTTARQVGEVTVRGWDSTAKAPIEYTARRSEIQTRGVGAAGGQAAIEQSFNQRREVIADRPINSRAEAQTLAVQTLEQIAKDMVTGTGATVGLPDLRAGGVVQIGGMGRRFSGRYFLTGTTHAISDSGYTTRFDCRREEL